MTNDNNTTRLETDATPDPDNSWGLKVGDPVFVFGGPGAGSVGYVFQLPSPGGYVSIAAYRFNGEHALLEKVAIEELIDLKRASADVAPELCLGYPPRSGT